MKRLLVLLSLVFVVACNGQNPIAPGGGDPQPVPLGNIDPSIAVNGAPAGFVNEDVAFPTSVNYDALNGAQGAIAPRSLDVRSVDTGDPVSFSVSISFPSAERYWRREIVWNFGDGSVYKFGCNRDNVGSCATAVKPTKKYFKAGSYTASVVAENCVSDGTKLVCSTQNKSVSVAVTPKP